MKLKESKFHAILFAQAISGMSGVKFPGITTASAFWHNPILDKMLGIADVSEDGVASENQMNNLLSLLGGSS